MQRDPTHTSLVQCLLEMGSSWIWSCQPGDTCGQGKESSTLQAATPKPRDSPSPGCPAPPPRLAQPQPPTPEQPKGLELHSSL